MSFAHSCTQYHLRDGHILKATLRDRDGNYRDSELDLNTCIGNTDGWFIWGGVNFSHSSNNVRLEGTKLVGKLTMMNQDYRELQGIELGECIQNHDGRLVYCQQ